MVSEEFRKNVETGNVVTVRSALVDYLIIDTSFQQFDEALDYAGQYMSVVEPDNGQQQFELFKGKWDEAYLSKQKVALMINFSKEKIEHIKQVIRNVLPDKTLAAQKKEVAKETPTIKAQVRNSYSSNESHIGRKIVEEKSSGVKKTEEEVHPIDVAAWMIGSGIVAAALGGVTVGVGVMTVKPAVLHAGIVVAGAGVVIAASGGVIKIVREK